MKSIGIGIGLIVGVVGLSSVQPAAAMEADKATVLYSFCSQQNCADGDTPYSDLIDMNGTLYGTTELGGARCTINMPPGCGTVFSLDPGTGAEKVLHSFCNRSNCGAFCSQQNCLDGAYPWSGLIDVNGTLYGTTELGGARCANNTPPGCGTVFSLDPGTGAEKVRYSFCSQQNCADGAYPFAGLIDVNGTLYGTTNQGGANGYGTVFALDPSTGAEKVLYSFCSQPICADGANPYAGLTSVKGTLYGTTVLGGYTIECCGTVFAINLATGAEKLLYSFQYNSTDGEYPYTSLIDVKGTLYGTTSYDAANSCFCGTVFSLDPSTGAETVLHYFSGTDGAYPQALIDIKGTLYDTTGRGGAYNGGTVFTFDPSTGAENVLYSFCPRGVLRCKDGYTPYASLINVNGTLYGTTELGGATPGCSFGNGCGTVFMLKEH